MYLHNGAEGSAGLGHLSKAPETYRVPAPQPKPTTPTITAVVKPAPPPPERIHAQTPQVFIRPQTTPGNKPVHAANPHQATVNDQPRYNWALDTGLPDLLDTAPQKKSLTKITLDNTVRVSHGVGPSTLVKLDNQLTEPPANRPQVYPAQPKTYQLTENTKILIGQKKTQPNIFTLRTAIPTVAITQDAFNVNKPNEALPVTLPTVQTIIPTAATANVTTGETAGGTTTAAVEATTTGGADLKQLALWGVIGFGVYILFSTFKTPRRSVRTRRKAAR